MENKKSKDQKRYYFTPDCYLDSEERKFYRNEEPVDDLILPTQEMNIMLYLCKNDKLPKDAEAIYESCHVIEDGDAKDPIGSIYTLIGKIRKKLVENKYAQGKDTIKTIKNAGYQINLFAVTNGETPEESMRSLKFSREDLWAAGYKWFRRAKGSGHRFNDLNIKDTLFSDTCDFDIYLSKNQDKANTDKTPLLTILDYKDGANFDRDNLFFIGEGGIGKTYALMWIMSKSYNNRTNKGNPIIPFSIFVELSKAPDYYCEATYGKNSSVMPSFIRRTIYRQLMEKDSLDSTKDSEYYWNLPNETAVAPVDQLLNTYQEEVNNRPDGSKPCLILLFDGLNEVSTATIDRTGYTVREYVTKEINYLMETYPSIKFILTSRTEHNGFSSETIVPHWLRGIDDDNIRDYLTNNANLPVARIDEICKNKKLMDLLRVPIFLRMFAPLAQDQEIAKDLTTRGGILRAFLTNREKIIYNTLPKIEEVHQGRQTPNNVKDRNLYLSPQMQHFILQFILPAIANEMEKNEAYQISRKASKDHAIRGIDEIIDSILPYSDGDNCKDTDICGAYGNYVFRYRAWGTEHTPESVAIDYLECMNENRKKIAKQIVDYCVSTLGILVSEGKAKPQYSFIHQHFRDYFSALYYVNQMKLAAYTFHDEEDVDIARAFMKDLEDRFLPQIIREMIGEYLGENLNAPVQDEEGAFTYNVPKDESDRTLIKRVIDLYRGEKPEKKPAHYGVLNLFDIIKDVRRDLSGSDFHDLDLRECSFSYVPLSGTCNGTEFTGSLINGSTWYPQGHESTISIACYSHNGKSIISASWDHTCRIWNTTTGKCIRVLRGHTDSVNSACFSHDDKWILSASGDYTCRIWNAESGDCLHMLEDHTNSVNSACFSHNDKWILSASWDSTCRIWNTTTGKCIRVLRGHTENVNYACFSHDDKRVLSASWDHTCRIWNADTGDCLHILEGHTDLIYSICFSHDDKRVLSASDDGTCRIWNAQTGECLHVLEGHTNYVRSACFSHDDKWILSASWDHTCRIWNADTGDCLEVLKGHTYYVDSACFSHDDKWILSASWDHTCRIWNADTGDCLEVLKGHTYYVNSACFNHNDKSIFSISRDNTIRIWNPKTSECLHVLDGPTDDINFACFSHDNKWILSASVDHTCSIWNAQTGNCLRILSGHTLAVNSACFSHDDEYIISASDDNTCRIWDAETGDCLHVLNGHTATVHSACFSHNDKWILSASYDYTCRIWDAQTGECLHVLKGHTHVVNSACFSHDNKWILSTSVDNTCRIWDTETGECLHILEGHTEPVYSACFSPDDEYIISASDDNTCRIWDTETGECLDILEGHYAEVRSACFSHDGKRILSTSYDSTCRIWDTETGECLDVLTGHIRALKSGCLSHDEKWILSTSYDGTCRIWNAKTGECLHILEGHTKSVGSACFSSDDKHVAFVSGNDICLWNASTGNRIRTLHYRPNLKIKGVDFTKIDGNSSISDLQKEQFQCMGGIVAPSNS